MGSFFDATEIATQIIEAAAGLANAYAAFEMLAVSRDYYDLYAHQKAFYYAVFQNGVEAPLAAQLFGVPFHALDYAGQAATINDPQTGAFGGNAGDIGAWWMRHANMYNAIPDPYITELLPDITLLKSDWGNYLFRYEEHFKDILDDIRWNGRLAMHNIGLKQNTAVSAALATGFGKYEDEIDDTADVFSAMGNGAAAYAGYRRRQADVAEQFTAYGVRQNSQTPADSAPARMRLPFIGRNEFYDQGHL